MTAMQKSLLIVLLLLLTACGQDSQSNELDDSIQVSGARWYSAGQVSTGAGVFAENCAVCHGVAAEGIVDNWKERLADGSFPPPPLNGSAHAWHHPQSVLLQVINEGGVALGGRMPGFESVLNQEEKLAAIAYFQNFWSDEIYDNWLQMGGTN